VLTDNGIHFTDSGYESWSVNEIKAMIAAQGDCPDIGGSCCLDNGRVCIADPVKSAAKSGTKRTVVNCAADLEQQIGAAPRPSHLLGLVHAPVDQEIRCAFGDRRTDPLTGSESLGVVDQPCRLAFEIGSYCGNC
jgi:hypothetical protein